jgi:hypothetical protein
VPGTDWRPTRVRPEVALEVRPPRRLIAVAGRVSALVFFTRGQDEQRPERKRDRRDDERNAIDAWLEPGEQMQADGQR